MTGVHDLDDVKLDLDGPIQSSSGISTAQPTRSQARARLNASKVNTKLEYYLTIAKTVKGASAVKLIGDILSSSGVYVFGEFLDVPGIAELAVHEPHSRYHHLLEIFAFGTWKDYQDNASTLPELNASQATKLKQLSVITRASHSRVIPYADLLVSLEIGTFQELEELIIDAIYSNIIEAKLDQKYLQVEMESCIGRDVRPDASSALNGKEIEMNGPLGPNKDVHPTGSVLELRSKLQSWTDSVGGVLDQLDQYIESIRQKDATATECEAHHNELVRQVIQTLPISTQKERKGKQKDTSGSHSKPKDDQMNLDETDELGISSKTRKRTRA
ncbi:hypothetical protein CROQUDRAFT_673594 [Cronartium quercuum f. sp. fusiforme G11]|uniref:PCI domain-containing protein n=1 Tax=Cronartium quercuum f. sp. fusiforme G11 TaxID=708437 RepID=A0A9P6T889_9BASI|nr:hypothetical protein CROQUDRAFT_673594 [Cronartium quercuum f. sp. fusiforme G11]